MIDNTESGQKLYVKLVNELVSKIQHGKFSDHHFTSENKLCAEYGVSRNTVRRALKILEDRGLLIKVQGKQRKINFHGDFSKKQTSNNICCLVSRFANHYNELCNHLSIALKKLGYNLLFTFENNNSVYDKSFFVREKCVACIFIGIHEDETIQDIVDSLGKNIPTVVINHNDCMVKVDNVGTDEYTNAFRAFQYLFELGHRRIGIIEHKNYPRITAGIKKCFELNNIPYNNDDFILPKYNLTTKDLDMFLSSNDYTALYVSIYHSYGEAVFNYIRERNIKVPDKLSVFGYDNIDISAGSKIIRQSCMGTRWDAIAKITAERICYKLNHNDNNIVSYRIESEIIERGTVKSLI